jgi:thiol-disulfide isomerase/thioredoxin
MVAGLRSLTRKLPLFAAIAVLVWGGFAVGNRAVAAEPASSDPPSIVGSSPLGGLAGATGWINSKPLTAKDLKGKVVVIDFWTYSCINCLRAVPYIRAWADKYKDSGLVVIGVHTPEFGFEKESPNVQKAIDKFGITYPVALDSKQAIWNAFHNEFWPAHYFIDVHGKVRYEHFGEGKYEESEKWIQELLAEGATKPMPKGTVAVSAKGAEMASEASQVRSPETYIGYDRAEHFASPGGIKQDREQAYSAPEHLGLNQWALAGTWVDHDQTAQLKSAGGKIVFRFHARDLHLVLGPAAGAGASGGPVHFRVTIDGHPPADNHGEDTDADGNGVVTDYRLYQLVRSKGTVTDHIFQIEFEDAGVQAFAFTFG